MIAPMMKGPRTPPAVLAIRVIEVMSPLWAGARVTILVRKPGMNVAVTVMAIQMPATA